MRKTSFLAVLENYIPKDVHTFILQMKEGALCQKPQKPFKGFVNSIVNSGKGWYGNSTIQEDSNTSYTCNLTFYSGYLKKSKFILIFNLTQYAPNMIF